MNMVEKIRKLIDDQGMTQTAFEVMAGLPQARISKWASGRGEPTLSQAFRMARALDVPLDYLADDAMEVIPAIPELTETEMLLLAVAKDEGGASEMLRRWNAFNSKSQVIPDDPPARGSDENHGRKKAR
jgi:transcriptional regulator with XRE-family HTH domain